jgi:hypothetical protein
MVLPASTDSEHPTPSEPHEAAVFIEAAGPGDIVAETLDHVVQHAAVVIRCADDTTVGVLRNGHCETVAASGELHGDIDAIEHRLAESPGRDVLVHGATVHSEDLRNELRWPEFSQRATALTDVLSILALPLHRDRKVFAVLTFYGTKAHTFDAAAIEVGCRLAAHAGICLAAAGDREKVANLEIALLSSRTIGMAMGVLMARHRISSQRAIDLLRVVSQHTNRTIAEIAADVVETGTLTARPGQPPYLGAGHIGIVRHSAALARPRLINKLRSPEERA